MKKIQLYKKIFLGVFMAILNVQNSYAESTVNIITWWDYLSKKIVAELENKCGVKISYDEYLTTYDFLKRMNDGEQDYSIAIFAQTGYNFVANKIANKGISLKKIKETYHPNVLNSTINTSLPDNVGIFGVESAGFLYDPQIITINPTDDLKDILKQAIGKKVIILDNPIEPLKFISPSYIFPENAISLFKDLFNGVEVIITNHLANFQNDKNIVLIHTWKGNALYRIKENPKLKFIYHPKISYMGADIIASLDNKPATSCVIKALASREINTKILSEYYVMSPFGNIEKNNYKYPINPLYVEINNDFYTNQIERLKWTPRPTREEYDKIIELWERIKIALKN